MRRKGGEGPTKYMSESLCRLPRRRVGVPPTYSTVLSDSSFSLLCLVFSYSAIYRLWNSPHQCSQLPRGDETRPLYCPRHLINSESLLVAFLIRQSPLFFVLFYGACLPLPRSVYSDRYGLVTPLRLQALVSFNNPFRKSIPLRYNYLFGCGKDSFAFS